MHGASVIPIEKQRPNKRAALQQDQLKPYFHVREVPSTPSEVHMKGQQTCCRWEFHVRSVLSNPVSSGQLLPAMLMASSATGLTVGLDPELIELEWDILVPILSARLDINSNSSPSRNLHKVRTRRSRLGCTAHSLLLHSHLFSPFYPKPFPGALKSHPRLEVNSLLIPQFHSPYSRMSKSQQVVVI
jgi:hypothetical protein